MKNNTLAVVTLVTIVLQACSPSHLLPEAANQELLQVAELRTAHIGICVFDPAKNSFLYDYQSDKYFVPASNTKLFSLYAGMKYLGDSLRGISYREDDTSLVLIATGDPTFLHPDFQSQPVFDFLKKTHKKIYLSADDWWKETPLGPGWA